MQRSSQGQRRLKVAATRSRRPSRRRFSGWLPRLWRRWGRCAFKCRAICHATLQPCTLPALSSWPKEPYDAVISTAISAEHCLKSLQISLRPREPILLCLADSQRSLPDPICEPIRNPRP